MNIHPKEIAGSSIAIFIWDHTGECGGSAVLFGIARFDGDEFYVERDKEPLRMPIPETAWESLRSNPDPGSGKTFEYADYVVMLRLGPMPDDDSTDDYERVNIPILEQDSSI